MSGLSGKLILIINDHNLDSQMMTRVYSEARASVVWMSIQGNFKTHKNLSITLLKKKKMIRNDWNSPIGAHLELLPQQVWSLYQGLTIVGNPPSPAARKGR